MLPDLSKLPFERFEWITQAPNLDNKILFVEFFATWCPPCQTAVSHLNKIYNTYKNVGVEVVGICDEEKEDIEKFIKDYNINYNIAITYYEDFKEYFDQIPYLILVSRDRQMYWKGFPLAITDQEIQSFIANKNILPE